MSFFAVLDTQDDSSRGLFDVDELHVNVWSLASLSPGRRTLVVDVGVKITAHKKHSVKGFTLALPFRVFSSRDLSEQLTENKTASLIFDSVAWYNPSNSELSVDDNPPMRLLRMDARSEKDSALSSDAITVWNVAFVQSLAPGTTGYFRMRFSVDPARAWQWQPAGPLRVHNGLLIDLRVADVRSTLELVAGESVLSRVLPIKKAYLFAVLPQLLSPSNLSPEPRYTRLLEPRVWGRYLDRKAEFFGRRLVVYQWKSEAPKKEGEPAVTTERPMRLYGRFDIRSRTGARRTAALAVVISFGLAAWLFPLPFKPEVIEFFEASLSGLLSVWQFVLLPLGVIGLASFLIGTVKWFRGIRDWLRKIEDWIFKKVFRPES